MKFTASLKLDTIKIDLEAKSQKEAEDYLRNLYLNITLDYVTLDENYPEVDIIGDNLDFLEDDNYWELSE